MTRKGVEPASSGEVGVGWSNPDGSISIRLQPFVVLSAMSDLVITAFPVDQKKEPG